MDTENTIRISDYLDDDSATDIVPAIARALAACRDRERPTLRFEARTYHFRPDRAPERFYHISNNDSGLKRIAFPLVNVNGLTIDGGGAEFMFHGRITPFAVDHCRNVILRNFTIDYDRPFFSQGEIVASSDEHVDLSVDSSEFPYCVEDGQILFRSDNWLSHNDCRWLMTQFDPRTRAPAANTGYYLLRNSPRSQEGDTIETRWEAFTVSEPGEGIVRLHLRPPVQHKVGNILTIGHEKRHHCGVFIHESQDVQIRDVTIHHTGAMGVLGQLSTDITLERVVVRTREGSPRIVSAKADATHFVNCEGTIRLEDCRFDNMLDDATNIHGIYSPITRLLDRSTVEAEFAHFQQLGICSYRPGDRVTFTEPQSMQAVYEDTVAEVTTVNSRYFTLRMEGRLPSEVVPGFATHNVTRMPAAVLRGCRTGNNRPRGFLLSTHRPVLVENNTFYNSSCAIQSAGDANYWYESGPVHDMTIRGNTFQNCGYADGSPPVVLNPQIPKPQADGPGYHRGVVIEGNTLISSSPSLLRASHVDGLIERDNNTFVEA